MKKDAEVLIEEPKKNGTLLGLAILFAVLLFIGLSVYFIGRDTFSKESFLKSVNSVLDEPDKSGFFSFFVEGSFPLQDQKNFLELLKDPNYVRYLKDTLYKGGGDVEVVKNGKALTFTKYGLKLNPLNLSLSNLDRRLTVTLQKKKETIEPKALKEWGYMTPGIYELSIEDGEKSLSIPVKLTRFETKAPSLRIDLEKDYIDVEIPKDFPQATIVMNGKSTEKKVKDSNQLGLIKRGSSISLVYRNKLGTAMSDEWIVDQKSHDFTFPNAMSLKEYPLDQVIFVNDKEIGTVSDFKSSDLLLLPLEETDKVQIVSPQRALEVKTNLAIEKSNVSPGRFTIGPVEEGTVKYLKNLMLTYVREDRDANYHNQLFYYGTVMNNSPDHARLNDEMNARIERKEYLEITPISVTFDNDSFEYFAEKGTIYISFVERYKFHYKKFVEGKMVREGDGSSSKLKIMARSFFGWKFYSGDENKELGGNTETIQVEEFNSGY
ncbi:zinc ribbon domain-containing protein [Guggenheimella bovis]